MDTSPEAGGNFEALDGVIGGLPAAGEVAPAQTAVRRTRRWPYIATIVVLAAGLLALGDGYAYSTNSAEQWRTTSEKTSRDLASMTADRDSLTQKNTTLTSQLGDTTNKLGDTTSKLNDTTTQLNTANDRIRSLANEKAQVGDSAAMLAELVAASQTVSGEMATCIHEHQNYETYLGGSRPYDQASVQSRLQSLNSVCAVAYKDSDSLTRTIQGLSK
ncbi:hypothetical protein [Arthrobacter sp. 92]|uniref:hypothetical protein n=1 Tax=Arthrobacter sp. 92 TaxID=3418175 RepID=UPI003CFEB43D